MPATCAQTWPSTRSRWRCGADKARFRGSSITPDRGCQYLSIRYTDRLAEAGAVTSVGSRGDSYDNALAESTIRRYKTELIRREGPWRTIDDVDLATLKYVDWYNHRRLHSSCQDLPPAEFEEAHYRLQPAPDTQSDGTVGSLH